MSSVQEQIVAAVVVVLNGPGKPAGVPAAQRARTFALSEALMPAALVYFLDDEERPVTDDAGPVVKGQAWVRVSCYAKGSATEAADQAADPMRAWAVKALHAEGTALEDLVNVCRLGRSRAAYSQGEHALCRLDLDFRVGFQADTFDPEQVT